MEIEQRSWKSKLKIDIEIEIGNRKSKIKQKLKIKKGLSIKGKAEFSYGALSVDIECLGDNVDPLHVLAAPDFLSVICGLSFSH